MSKFQMTVLVIASFGLCFFSACKKTEPTAIDKKPIPVASGAAENWPPLKEALACLAQTGPIIAQHRGRSKDSGQPDNSLIGLKTLRAQGYIMAEIDVARLKDGTHILFHDGVWDDDSTGQGPVAASTIKYAQTLLLKNSKNKISSERPLTLSDALTWADKRLYLEIDFKSSANVKQVVQDLESADMLSRSVLIAYNKDQARRLHKAAPNAMISAPIRKLSDVNALKAMGLKPGQIVGWMGTKDYNVRLASKLKSAGVFTAFGLMSPRYAKQMDYSNATILATDYADEAKQKFAQTRLTDAARLKRCAIN